MQQEQDTLQTKSFEVPNLTKLNWDQPLVASIRLCLWGGFIQSIPAQHLDGTILTEDELKDLAKRDHNRFNSLGLCDDLDMNYLDYFGHRVRALIESFSDKQRAGAIIAIILTELGWPVHSVTQILNTSRPTLNRWIMVNLNKPITDAEIALVKDSRVRPVDIRSGAFKTRRTGLVWKKAVFLPDERAAATMKALWRIAYRVRGTKSPLQETVCSNTLDIMVEMLLRRGVTALNIGKILGIQHMAVLQRNRKSKDVFGQVEKYLVADPSIEPVDRVRALADNTVIQNRVDNDDNEMRAFLLQVRTSMPSEFHPIPAPNISVLAEKTAVEDGLPTLRSLDELPLYDVVSTIDSIHGWYSPALPSAYPGAVQGIVEHLLSEVREGKSVHSIRSLSPLLNPTLAAMGYDAFKYNYAGQLPLDWREGRIRSEAALLQATMQYNRKNEDGESEFGLTTYHWVPAEVLPDTIFMVTEGTSRGAIEMLHDAEVPERQEFDLAAFFPEAQLDLIENWLEESEAIAEGNSLLWKCFYAPGDIVDTFDAPVSRGKETA